MNPKVLLIYTGGTIGMAQNPKTGSLYPFDFNQLLDTLPSLRKLNVDIGAYSFDEIIDSSDMNPHYWLNIAQVIESHYQDYDGFVVLHGTDTMSYTASALSFMFGNLSKPILLTGSQLPIGVLRSDGKDNLINSIEIAAHKENGRSLVPEVCICFENSLYRGNRTTKLNAENFNAFYSGNHPPLAEVGIHVKYNRHAILPLPTEQQLKVYSQLDDRVGILKIHPGLSQPLVENILQTKHLQGLVLETYGSGNAPSAQWLKEALSYATRQGMIILNVTQCKAGGVEMGKYAASLELLEAGVTSGLDMTTESAICKMMVLLGTYPSDKEQVKTLLQTPLCGEMTIMNNE
ncbi:L-asparaginase 1 [Bacteroidia bacterium]|nr:L-asparaginase 1 [Bacteroidia bacterium]